MSRAALAFVLLWLVELSDRMVAGATVSGGGAALSDCYVVLEGATTTSSRRVECLDGTGCDADAASDGSCSFDLRVCINQPGYYGCDPRRRVVSLTVEGYPLDLPRVPSLRSRCGQVTRLTVPLRRLPSGRLRYGKWKLRLKARRLGKPAVDHDMVSFRCQPNPCPENGPAADGLWLGIGGAGSDLDFGWSGAGHNLRVRGRSLPYCMADCPSDDFSCAGTLNPIYALGDPAISPVPIVVGGTPLCLQPRLDMSERVHATATSGDVQLPAKFQAAAYVTTAGGVCPRCSDLDGSGTTVCDAGPNRGISCQIDGLASVAEGAGRTTYPVSADCPPSEEFLAARITADMVLTTGTTTIAGPGPCPAPDGTRLPDDLCESSACTGACSCLPDDPQTCGAPTGGVHQWCCGDDPNAACFPSGGGALGSISRAGAPVPLPVPLPDDPFPNRTAYGSLAGTTCAVAEPPGVPLIVGLDGPTAVVLPMSATWLP